MPVELAAGPYVLNATVYIMSTLIKVDDANESLATYLALGLRSTTWHYKKNHDTVIEFQYIKHGVLL